MRSAFSLFAALLLSGSALALPTGAPKCAINPAVITAAHQAPSPAAGYKISASAKSYTPGQPLTITIAGTTTPIAGTLLYATPGTQQDAGLAPNNGKEHVGVFKVPAGFRAQTATICDAAAIKNDAPESTITHANPTPKGNSVTFEWTAPATASGPISFNAAVAGGAPGAPWQVLDVLTLQSAGGNTGGNTTTTPGRGGNSTTTPPNTGKCPNGGKKNGNSTSNTGKNGNNNNNKNKTNSTAGSSTPIQSSAIHSTTLSSIAAMLLGASLFALL
ncbi:uncharacterized protein SPPG_04369 [Spizellomyces punctatus DAOM BR117]|uniref:Reelin domain-containing protein n=1 Tax=Spizellomyces punctatus (strain DAOM BR117) TaxID=645134 RepID=A0A0L0HG25_SPIPD|nr:uncharacterized protein SPPG_04369 [Spizellomyces punctatus DAOM BR117]KND00023.1 hypothetical protein SPPG_04369 [Spizellomyces punctatus DAOM BR117]|eukprot:XP_016608062.1 hypothetical protein SPPG_04369 [Spizellomyces punctatus DAOM BR117]